MKQKILILLMALFSLPSFAQTEEVFYEYEGNTLVYVLNEQNLTCTTKRYSDIESAAMQLITNGNVVIPSVLLHNYKKYTVVGIGDNGFKNRKEITSIEIPNTVNYVGRGAFSGCLNLSTVKIADGESSLSLTTDMFSGAPVETIYFGRNWSGNFPSSISTVRSVEFGTNVTRFNRDIFSDCTGLTSMDIPNSVTSIGRGAFSGCSGLKSISIPNSVSIIEDNAFKGCTGLTSIDIPNSVVSIGSTVFEGCNGLKDVRIVDGEAEISIKYDVFSNCQMDNLYMGRNWSVGSSYSIFLNVKNLQLGNNVTKLPEYAFSDCSELTSIDIPNSVTSIGERAFSGCSGLTSMTIPNSVSSIGERAFSGCSGLTSMTIPNSVSSIGERAFSGCSGLTSMTIPNSVSSIGERALYGCSGLVSIKLSNLLTSIEEDTFSDCSRLTSIDIPNSVTSIGSGAFSGCSGLTSIGVPNSVTSIGNRAFSGCTGLVSIKLSNVLTSIENGTFSGCSGLTSISIPDSVSFIGSSAFSGCSGLTSISIPDSVSFIGERAFYDCSGLTSVLLPQSLTEIRSEAFKNCSSLTSVIIPPAVNRVGKEVFAGCSLLKRAAYPRTISNPFERGVTVVDYAQYGASVENGFVYGSDKTAILYAPDVEDGFEIPEYITAIGEKAFYGCRNLTSITIPNKIESIGKDAFSDCPDITSLIFNAEKCFIGNAFPSSISTLTIGDKVTVIPDNFLADGSSIESLELPEMLVTIGKDAFRNSKLTSVVIPSPVTSVGENAFYRCEDLKKFRVEDGDSEIAFGTTVLYGAPIDSLYLGKNWSYTGNESISTGIKSVVIGNRVTSLPDNAFKNCSGLTSVIVPPAVERIGSSAFSGCTGLIKSAYPEGLDNPFSKGISVAYLSENAVVENGFIFGPERKSILFVPFSLEGEYTVPNSVESIGQFAFIGCTALTSVNLPESVRSIGQSAFNGCTALTSMDIPNPVESIGESAFNGCTVLTYVNLPNSLTSIENSTFEGCSALTSIVIPSSVTTVGENAFYRCEDLKEFRVEDGDSEIAFGRSALYGAPIDSLYLGKNWTYSGNESISTGIKSVAIGNRVTFFPANAFRNCKALTSVNLPESVRSIGEYAFNGCTALTSVNLPNSLASIEKSTFEGCSALASVVIPQTVTFIGENAFKSCSALQSIIIPSQVASIGKDAFSDCKGLKKTLYPNTFYSPVSYGVKISYDPDDFSEEDGLVYNKDKTILLFAPLSLAGECKVPASVDSIGVRAFSDCSSLTSVVIPSSVKSIGEYAFGNCNGITSLKFDGFTPNFGSSPFYGIDKTICDVIVPVSCFYSYVRNDALTGFKISTPDGSVDYYDEADTGLRYAYSTEAKTAIVLSWNGNSDKLIMPRRFVVEEEGSPVFYDVIGIADNAFDGKSISEIELPRNLQFIGDKAFRGCSKLSNIVLPDQVKSVGDYAFALCPLNTIAFNEGLETIGRGAFSNDVSKTRLVFFETQAGTPYIHYWLTGNSSVTTTWPGVRMNHLTGNIYYYDIPETMSGYSLDNVGVVFNLGSNSNQTRDIYVKFGYLYSMSNQYGDKFNQMQNRLTELKFPSSLLSIGEYAFAGSDNLKLVEFNDGLSVIGEYGFSDCGNLEKIVLHEGPEAIRDFTFNNCNRLGGEVIFPEGLQSIGESAFNGSQFTSVSFPATLKDIKKKAFFGNTALASIQFAETRDLVISESAFSSEGNNLTSLNLAEGVVEIEKEAFKGSPIVDLKMPSSLKTVADNVFSGNNISELSIPNTVESFGNITIADRINIEDGADMVSLASLTAKEIYCGRNFGESGENTSTKFNAEQLAFGNMVTTLPSGSFAGENVAVLNLSEGLKEIGNDNFKNCKNLTKVVIPPSVETVGSNAFASGNLETVAIGCGVKTIGDEAFANNEGLNTIEITAINPPAANNNVFSYYNGTLYTVPALADIYMDYPSCWYRFDNQVSKLTVATEVVVDKESIANAKPGEQYQLSAQVMPAEALQYVFWKSTNPAIAKVDYKGVVTIMDPTDNEVWAYSDETCEIHAYSLYDGSPIAVCTINVDTAGVEDVIFDSENGAVRPNDVYNMQGVCVKRNATQEDIDSLAPGLYIIGGKKVMIR